MPNGLLNLGSFEFLCSDIIKMAPHKWYSGCPHKGFDYIIVSASGSEHCSPTPVQLAAAAEDEGFDCILVSTAGRRVSRDPLAL